MHAESETQKFCYAHSSKDIISTRKAERDDAKADKRILPTRSPPWTRKAQSDLSKMVTAILLAHPP